MINQKNSIIGLMLFVFHFFGCASNPSISNLGPEQRSRLNELQVFKGGTERPYIILGSVRGLSCHRNAYQTQLLTENEAIEGVKINAILLEADAVINCACQVNSGTDWVNNCWSSIVCVGDAIKFKK